MSHEVVILSREPKCYSTRRLSSAFEKRGHRVRVLSTTRFTMSLEERDPQLFYDNEPVDPVHIVVPRIGASVTFYGTAVVRQFEQMGVFTLNSSGAIAASRDKLRSLQVLSRHDVGIPPTVFVREKRGILPAIERLGGVPVIIKLLEGTQGKGVILAETLATAAAIIETLQTAQQNVLIQKFVAESRGRDIRALVVGGRVVAAMRRQAQGDEFRSNVHLGGKTEPVELSPEYQRTAVLAAQILGLRVAGVDLLEASDGPKVMEVNSSPGLEGIESATGVDIAGAIAAHAESEVLFPEFDVRQRLTSDPGYAVVELIVHRDSELAEKTIADARLPDREVQVLSIRRGDITIPAPGPATRIHLGDDLVCYGSVLALRPLVSSDGRPRARPRLSTSPGRAPLPEPEPDPARAGTIRLG